MFAVIKTGGKQYKVAPNDVVTIERLAGAAGDKVTFDEVLMIGGEAPAIGAPLVEGARVAAEVVEQTRGDKILVFKKKRRHNYRRTKGHRQDLTTVRILEIVGAGGKRMAAAAKPAKSKAKPGAPREEALGDAPERLIAPRGEADDLAQMTGVGPKIVDKLNGIGVYHFAQIAAWTQANAAWVDAELDLKGRIERDDWVGQAKKLAAGKD